MASITTEQLKKEIHDILEGADLSTTSSKKVRQQLEEKLKCDLTKRKSEIDGLIMDYVNSNKQSSDEDDESDEDSEPSEKKGKRSSSGKKPSAKKRKSDSSESGSDEGSDDDYSPKKGAAKNVKKKAKDSDSDSDADWKQEKKPKAKKVETAAAKPAGKKGTGFTRPYQLSPELAELMGEDHMARHEVVKKIWAIIKEKNLYDPKNKQYAICDEKLQKVIGVKRFRTFGMMKYLMPHFIK
jgi:upstream activation factor subunit UAF30